MAETLSIRGADTTILLRIGPAPDYLFEWGEETDPGEAGRLFAEAVSQRLREIFIEGK